MDILLKKKRSEPLTDRYTVSVTSTMKKKLEELKEKEKIDVNEMIRQFFDKTIETADQQSA